MEPLHPVEVRVLGSLLEKDLATPDYYPLTLNALQNACNQKSSRDPIMILEEAEVGQALSRLRHSGLASTLSGVGHRVEKYGHRLGERNLGRRELALLCVLMLRGAQTLGELRGRTERIHSFSDLDEVERVLQGMAALANPLVAPFSRGRWVHTWHEHVDAPDSPAALGGSLANDPSLVTRLVNLEQDLADLRAQFADFRARFE
jgi:uncharacterized protein